MPFKVCCIQDMAEAEMAIEAGATAIGLVGPMPSGPGIIDLETAAQIVKAVAGNVDTFFLCSAQSVDEISRQHEQVGSTHIQLVDQVEDDVYGTLKSRFPELQIVQVVHVVDSLSVKLAVGAAGYADALLLDSGNPKLQTKILGGTGNTHNWEFSSDIVRKAGIPVWLAVSSMD